MLVILNPSPVIRGTRIPVELIVKLKGQGRKNEEILKEYPALKEKDIRVALFYAERVLEEEEIFSFDGMSGVKPGKKSTLRLPGLKAGLAFDPSSGRGCAAEWVKPLKHVLS